MNHVISTKYFKMESLGMDASQMLSPNLRPLIERGAYDYQLRFGKAYGLSSEMISDYKGRIVYEGYNRNYEWKIPRPAAAAAICRAS